MCLLPHVRGLSVFGQREHPDVRLSLKWIDANGSRCCNRRCHKQGQTGSQQPAPALCGTKWSATLNKSTRYRADAGINLSVLGSSRILSLLLAGSKSNKQEDKWRTRRKKRGGEDNKEEKQWDFFCQPPHIAELIHTERMCRVQNKKPENHLLWAAAERCPIFSTTFMQLPLSLLLSEQPLPPRVLLQLWSSFHLQFISHTLALFFLHLHPHSSNWFLFSWDILLDRLSGFQTLFVPRNKSLVEC